MSPFDFTCFEILQEYDMALNFLRYKLHCFFLLSDAIMQKIEEAGFRIAMQKEVTLTQDQVESFYAEHKDADYFEPLVKQMTW